jgi:signal transduction histidine kinase
VSYDDGHPLRTPTSSQVTLILIGATALFFRWRYPVAVTVVTVLCGSAVPIFAPHTIVFDAASVIALYTCATLVDRRVTWAAGGLAVGFLTFSSALWLPGHVWNIHNVLPVNYVVIAVAVGDAVRNRRVLLAQAQERVQQVEREREQDARRLVQEERIRIARDLHDVVAHHITLVNAQAGVAHHLLRSDPDRAYQALADIRETSRTALDELRATVGLLRQDDDPPQSLQPAPRFEFLDDLLASFRTAGFDVRLTRHGVSRPLTGTADLAAYRIVQEALTNASKHGAQPHADLELSYTGTELRLTVRNLATSGRRGPGTGHGLIGMRERAEAAVGTFTAELRPDHTYVVQAALPLQALTL